MASPYRKRHDNFAQQESEYKDVVISKLKASAFELRQNEQECDDLSLRLNNLNHRLNLLQNEKDLDEKEHNHRNDLNTKTIYNLKDEVRALEAELQRIEDDIALRRDDNDGVNRIISSRSAELAKLKCQLADLADDNKALTLEIKDLEHQNNKLKKEIEEDLEFSQQVNHKIEEASQRRDNSQKIIRELESEEEELIKQNNQLKAEQKDVRLTVANRSENLKEAEYELSENRKDIVALQARVDNQKRANERLNKEIAIGQQEQEKESAKAADQSSKIKVLEELNQEREDEIQELRRQLAQLRKENNENLDENDDLNNDIEACNKHLDALTYEHHQLLEEIERFDHEDAGVRRVLQRESRVMNTKAKYEDKMRSSLSTMNTTLQSPTKSAGLNSALSKAH